MRLLTVCIVLLLTLAAGRTSAEVQPSAAVEVAAGSAITAEYHPPSSNRQGPHNWTAEPFRGWPPRTPNSYLSPRRAPGPAYRDSYGPYRGYQPHRYYGGAPGYGYFWPSQPYAQRRWQQYPNYGDWRRRSDYQWAGGERTWVPTWRYRQADRGNWHQQWRW